MLRDLREDLGEPIDAAVRAGRLVVVESVPDPNDYLERIRETLHGLSERHSVVRGLGRVSWGALGYPLPEDHLWVESRIDEMLGGSRAFLLCSYDATEMPGTGLAFGGLETHPQILMGGRLVASPSFIDPARYVADRLLDLPWLAPS